MLPVSKFGKDFFTKGSDPCKKITNSNLGSSDFEDSEQAQSFFLRNVTCYLVLYVEEGNEYFNILSDNITKTKK